MSLMSWLHVPQHHRAPALNKPSGRQSSRRPIHSRLFLEPLEQRMLLNGSNGLFGGDNNLTVNGGMGATGVILPVPTSGYNVVASSASSSQAATADFLAQDQPYAQFRLFGVNSQGDDARLGPNTVNILRNAYGFGSGTAPNAPWMPNAYNLGLANHQVGYPSQTDMGFSSVPPWSRSVAQAGPKDKDPTLGPDQLPSLKENKDEEATEAPEQLAARKSLLEQEQGQQKWIDDDVRDKSDDWKARFEQQTSQKQSSLDRVVDEDGNLPDSLWLSALAPAPMAALVAGLPGMAAEAESGEVGEVAVEAAE